MQKERNDEEEEDDDGDSTLQVSGTFVGHGGTAQETGGAGGGVEEAGAIKSLVTDPNIQSSP